MKTLKFKGFKAQWILENKKTATMRLFDDKKLSAGDELELINSDNNDIFAYAKIFEVIEKKLRELTESDFKGHERWRNNEEMYEGFRKYYGDRVTPDTIVKIIRFATHD